MPTYNPNDFYPQSDAEVKSDGNVAYRENTSGTLLASATRTATNSTPTQTNYNARGVIIFLNITAASGTGGLQVSVYGVDPVSGALSRVNAATTAITTTGTFSYALYPGVTAGYNQSFNTVVPKTFVVTVSHGDATNYTYSLGYSFIL